MQQSCYGIWNEESIDFSLWSARENYQPTSCGNFLGEFAPEWISTSTLVWSKKNPLPHMSIGSWRTSRDTVHWIKGVAEHLISCQVNMFAWAQIQGSLQLDTPGPGGVLGWCAHTWRLFGLSTPLRAPLGFLTRPCPVALSCLGCTVCSCTFACSEQEQTPDEAPRSCDSAE